VISVPEALPAQTETSSKQAAHKQAIMSDSGSDAVMVAIPSVLPPSTAGSVASASSNDSLCELDTLKQLISTAKKAQKVYSKFSQAQVCNQCQRQATVAAACVCFCLLVSHSVFTNPSSLLAVPHSCVGLYSG
jgi:hypothetical protein